MLGLAADGGQGGDAGGRNAGVGAGARACAEALPRGGLRLTFKVSVSG